jgi:Fe-S cluster assembly ATPase SufC
VTHPWSCGSGNFDRRAGQAKTEHRASVLDSRGDSAQMVITHYQQLLNFIVPDFVHVLYDGRIVKSGDKQLALELEAKGYDWITKAA